MLFIFKKQIMPLKFPETTNTFNFLETTNAFNFLVAEPRAGGTRNK